MDKKILEEYLNGYSPVGCEAYAQKKLIDYILLSGRVPN